MKKLLLSALTVPLLALPRPQLGAPAAGTSSPNIVFILTDDQRYDELTYMPTLQSELVGKGVLFTNAFVSNPLCCPSRSTILTGRYSHGTGVYQNLPPDGGFQGFGQQDGSTVATWLHDGGYRTAMIGKYLNGYSDLDAAYIPPGWDRWESLILDSGPDGDGKGGYYNFDMSNDGYLNSYPKTDTGSHNYSTDVLTSFATDFIRSSDPGAPLFLYLALRAPHAPATQAPGDRDALAWVPNLRPPNYNEADVTDKPAYIRRQAPWDASRQASNDAFYHQQLNSLIDVDRSIAGVLQALTDTGRLSNTLLVFTSDNGEAIGENRWRGKGVPYEASIRVPLVVRYDPLTQGSASTDPALIANVDYAPTFAAAAGVSAPGSDGVSFLPLLTDPAAPWRSDFLLEHLAGSKVPTYCGIRTNNAVYVEYGTGEQELYDLNTDPWEMQNRAGDVSRKRQVRNLHARMVQLCSPPPPGFTP